MINTKSAREFLNRVSPEIRKYWERKDNVSLSSMIARIEEIDENTEKHRKILKKKFINFFIIASTVLIVNFLAQSAMIFISTMTILLLYLLLLMHSEIRINRVIINEASEQEKLSASFTCFWEKILKVCHNHTLPSRNDVDAEYLKGVLHEKIKDLLLKKAVLESQRTNLNFSANTVYTSALTYGQADEYLDNQWEIVRNELGVPINKRQMFINAAQEMRVTHPGLSEYFKVE